MKHLDNMLMIMPSNVKPDNIFSYLHRLLGSRIPSWSQQLAI